jgi:hypothetical protein
MAIHYHTNHPITADQFIELLRASTLGERRPLEDRECMEGMVNNANLTITAWEGERQGIGKQLLRETQQQLKPSCKIILLSAPAAVDYYPHLGFERHPQAWLLTADKKLG